MATIMSLEECKCAAPGQIKSWCYNALDVTGTREIADVLLPRLTPVLDQTYAFERALQSPAMAMMRRGVRVDTRLRDKLVRELKVELAKDMKKIAAMPEVADVWDKKSLNTGWCPVNLGKRHKWPKGIPDEERKCEHCHADRLLPEPFNPGSPEQCKHLFYELHGLPLMYDKKKKVSVDDDILDRISAKYPKLANLSRAIQGVRDKTKQLGTLNSRLSGDNRWYSSFNVGAAWTGRFSSSKNPYHLGGNLQNIAERHRAMFIADPGMEIGYADLKTAESQDVAYQSGDEAYIEAHKTGDVHTYVTRLLWDLGWEWVISKDKKIAKGQNPTWDPAPGHDYRFQSKRIQHGSNYLLTPYGIAIIAHIPQKEADTAQGRYFHEFPYIRGWQEHQAKKIRDHQPLTNPLGRQITLFGRPSDPHTIKQGVAFEPQSAIADILDLAMWRVWKEMDPGEVQILAQVHDAILFQYPKGRLDLVRKMARLMRVPVDVKDYRGNVRRMIIPVEVAVGSNWGHISPSNPFGLNEVEV